MSIGIDVGSRFLKIAVLGPESGPSFPTYVAHGGRPLAALRKAYESLDLQTHAEVSITGSGADSLGPLLGIPVTDLCRATILGARSRFPEVRNILDIGAGSVTLIELTEAGELKDVSTNSLCAAGTGSFLDAQAVRMGVRLEESRSFASVATPRPSPPAAPSSPNPISSTGSRKGTGRKPSGAACAGAFPPPSSRPSSRGGV
jgi:activator of 2-hydroxyglutaryl-CoA dehydratase